MCGIAGFLRHDQNMPENAHLLMQRMIGCLHHRGPDDQGVYVDGPVALGHRRLAILDLSQAGAQPMQSHCGRYTIVYNGEIYNHPELRHELEQAHAGFAWRGHSDTETLLAGFAHWGVDETLRRAHGMFALALWDRLERRLFLARDRMGEKPLYWGWAGKDFIFASELKALRAYPETMHTIAPEALTQYVRFACVPAPYSIFSGIYKLEPGTILELRHPAPSAPPLQPVRPGQSHGSISIRRYFSLISLLEAGQEEQFENETEALVALEKALRLAVSRQLLADVSVGAFLSGGIDSSLIVALMQEISPHPVKTFTASFENDAYNEAPYAAAVARHLETDHHEVLVSEREAQEIIPQLPIMYDEPFADSSQIATHLISKIARQKVVVSLSGDGGDELFGGYNRYVRGLEIFERVRQLPAWLQHLMSGLIYAVPQEGWDGLFTWLQKIAPIPQFSLLSNKLYKLAKVLEAEKTIESIYRILVSYWSPHEVLTRVSDVSTSVLRDPLPASIAASPAGWMMAQDMRTYLPDDILQKVDRASMATSLETRAPFLDPEVLKIAAKIPLNMKIRNKEGKWALRQLLYKRVPRELLDRPKAGFAVPVGEWLRGPLREWAEDLLSLNSLAQDGYFKPEPVQEAWSAHMSRRRDHGNLLWVILMFQEWRKTLK